MGRRCVSDKIVESDAFYKLPEKAQALYLHLTLNADDDGFLNNAESVAGKMKGGKDALKKLVEKRFLLQFGDIYVIKHWRISNSLKNDRLKPPAYASVAMQVWIKPNKAYTDHPVEGAKTLYEAKTGIQLESGWNPVGIQLESQLNRTEENRTEENLTKPPKSDLWGGFIEIWNEYPELKRGSQNEAVKAFTAVIGSQEDVSLAVKTLDKWKRSAQWHKNGGQYVPFLCNWLERGLWSASPDKYEIPKGASGELGEAELEAIRRIMAE